MKRRKRGALRGPIQRRPAPDGYHEAAFSWRAARLAPLQQILLRSGSEIPIRRRWWEWTYDGWREIE